MRCRWWSSGSSGPSRVEKEMSGSKGWVSVMLTVEAEGGESCSITSCLDGDTREEVLDFNEGELTVELRFDGSYDD